MADNDILGGVGKFIKMGVGAVAGAVEKGVNYVNEVTTEGTEANKRATEIGEGLAKKGEEIIGKAGQFGDQIKEKAQSVMASSQDYDSLMNALDSLSLAELKALKTKIEALIALKPDEFTSPFAQAEEPEAAPEDETSDDTKGE